MLAIVLWSLLFTSTGQADEYITDVQRWRQQRLKALTAEEGFLSLAGLYWLSEGKNTFGAA